MAGSRRDRKMEEQRGEKKENRKMEEWIDRKLQNLRSTADSTLGISTVHGFWH